MKKIITAILPSMACNNAYSETEKGGLIARIKSMLLGGTQKTAIAGTQQINSKQHQLSWQ